MLSLSGISEGGLKVPPPDTFGELVVMCARREDLSPWDLPLVRLLKDRLPANQADRHCHVRACSSRLRILQPRVVR